MINRALEFISRVLEIINRTFEKSEINRMEYQAQN